MAEAERSKQMCNPSNSLAELMHGRRIHVIDIENLSRSPHPRRHQISWVKSLYAMHPGLREGDQVFVASSHVSVEAMVAGWPEALYAVQSGPDGAELALLEVLDREDVAMRFAQVVIGSGDKLFAETAKALRAQGIWVTVVTWEDCLSDRLEAAADLVIRLDDVQAQAA